jgi:hypothetical protein
MRWAGHAAHIEEKRRGVYRESVGNPEGNRTLGRPRRKWKDINMGGAWTGSIWLRKGKGGGHL